METVACPQHWNTLGAISLNRRHQELINAPDVGVDVRSIDFVKPFGTLLIAESLRIFVLNRAERGLTTHLIGENQIIKSTSNALSYLKYFGFFHFVRLSYGNKTGIAPGSNTYIPITEIKFENLIKKAEDIQFQDTIKRKCDKLATIIVNDDYSKLLVGYCFREIIRNVYEHSHANYCVIMAQKYSNQVEIAILDTGIGIYESLRSADCVVEPQHALRYALLPGVSRALNLESKNRWANSGFGLYVLSELGKKMGAFEICSSGNILSCYPKHENINTLNYSGTGIRLVVSLKNAEYFPNVLQSIVEQGEQETFTRTGIRHSASMSTHGLWG
ncbi:ATP-binding region, ATPase-like protein [Chlorobaculum parvum NCIB 8327]|uniref:ATP-binding region, ATPase-like protein n=1 Tax=Chlorobaculum parvum (strain DSM 263 / NCIMB 8327) TaxID=517417 RepID=B3QLM6_CHLP8|nr:ATP-binding region, ATPase-like protein [Chlorobaculum parvum]ACF10916.1 ATP-binding region, ATPase-like protein [Chlorobaculum parvum NCIB 8327]